MLKRIYPVDDDAGMRASVLSLLTFQSDVSVQCFGSGDTFLDQSATLEPGVILLDMNMPGSSGMEVLRKLLEQPDKFVPIVVTGERSIPLAVQAMQAGATDLLEKPYAPDALIQAIDTAFDRLAERSRIARRAETCRCKIARLSSRERDVLDGMLDGLSNKEIARVHDISPRTIEVYRANLMTKLGVRTLAGALHIALHAGIVADS